jgi:glycosyltransferase involved in cell wall biosynthesis
MSRPVRLAVIIVSYNVRDLLRTCLNSVAASTARTVSYLYVETVVVDNASDDDSLAAARGAIAADPALAERTVVDAAGEAADAIKRVIGARVRCGIHVVAPVSGGMGHGQNLVVRDK